ncbi:MAG: DNA topoisomerase IV subunit A, partial [Rhodoferax sp.]|nr:DNA topoisomerase IV subunit A [Rhodoferax sp.]
YGTFECRTVDTLLAFGEKGRVYSVPVAALPGARGDGQPITSLIELEPGTALSHYFAGPAEAILLLASSGAYGFLARVGDMVSRLRAGKAFLTCAEGETICQPAVVAHPGGSQPQPSATQVACVSVGGRVLTFDIGEIRYMAHGGRGLMLLDLEAKDSLAGVAAYQRSIRITGIGRGGKPREETLEIRSLNNAKGARARKGRSADFGFRPQRVQRIE